MQGTTLGATEHSSCISLIFSTTSERDILSIIFIGRTLTSGGTAKKNIAAVIKAPTTAKAPRAVLVLIILWNARER